MIHKTGKSNCLNTIINYTLRDADHNNILRESVKIIRGDPNDMTKIAENLNQKNNAIHSMLRFTKKENRELSNEQKLKILNSFIKELAIGLPNKNRLASMVVEHDSNTKNAHYHIISLKTDIESGKSYQPWVVQRGDKERFHTWNDVMTDSYGLENPDSKPRPQGKSGSENSQSKEQKKNKDYFEREINSLVESQHLQNREDVIKYLKKFHNAEITRKNDNFLSFKIPGHKRAMRFKGFLFTSAFTSLEAASDYLKNRKSRPDANASKAKLAEMHSKMKQYHEGRYKTGSKMQKHEPDHNINTLMNRFLNAVDSNSALQQLKNEADKSSNSTHAQAISFKEAVATAKNFNSESFSEYDCRAVTVLLESYDSYKGSLLERDIERNAYFEDHDYTESDRSDDEKIVTESREVEAAMNNISVEINMLENDVKTLEKTAQSDTQKSEQKEQRKQSKSNNNSGGEKKLDTTKGLREMVSAWRKGNFETKRNDARNYAAAKFIMRDSKPQPDTKKKKKKKSDD